MTLRPRILLGLAALAVVGSACGAVHTPCNSIQDLSKGMTINLPPSLGGLRVAEEKKATSKLLEEAKLGSYICGGRVFSLRKDKELRGVLQVGRLSPDARPAEKEWRKTVADGANARRAPVLVGKTLVYTGVFNRQQINLWFADRFMLVLTVRAGETVAGRTVGVDFKRLITEALSLQPVREG